MSFVLKFTPEAEETYDSLVAQLKHTWGARYVVRFEIKVLKSLKMIADSPYLYPVIEDNTNIRRCVLHKNCSLLYKIYDDIRFGRLFLG